jgi:hypothetical protein
MGQQLLEKLNQSPDACWLFCSSQSGLQDLVKGVFESTAARCLVGCTTAGEISTAGFSKHTAVLGGIVADQIEFEAARVTDLKKDSEAAGRKLAQALPPDVCYVQVFTDGLTGNGCAFLRGIQSVLSEKIPISGGTAGDDGRFIQTFQFHGDQVLTDAAVAIGFKGEFTVGTGVQSGWAPIGLAKKVTRASGNVLYELNGEPALNVLQRFLGKHAEKLPAVGVEYPLGFYCPYGDNKDDTFFLLRATMSVNREQGSVKFAGEIPEGAMIHLTCGDNASLLNATEKAARMACEDLGQATPAMVFFYSCMARNLLLGQRTKEEITRVKQTFKAHTPVLGFYSYGEFCQITSSGPSVLHNETATVSAIGI